ncbi:chemotaxis protein CheW [Inconstantimicrobium mannanitabidum]|uniref:Chemotaxis protein CheW n=1 Tax=Inconstantimicrobium mannanitabidum TaxID=1604901 RepID=A0ACB5R8S9_9CLOT|nr:chemotaxis protein CheW [Clostridium sp. TW13]GKX65447.1 chemotaxis protein CheW [Clostridium sp. TW13]
MNNNEVKLLIFSLNGEKYATDIMDVERILGYETPTELPDSPDFVKGVINYEDGILPIMSLSAKFNFGDKEIKPEAKIVVIKDNDFKIGIIVDNVYEVMDVKTDLIEKPSTIGASISQRYMSGLIRLDDKIVILLDVPKILNQEEKDQLR